MSDSQKPVKKSKATGPAIVIGGVPRANLLPPEIKADARARGQRRFMLMIAAIALAVVAGGFVLATAYAADQQARLDLANIRTQEILLEQGKYVIAQQMSNQVGLSQEAAIVGASTEVDWKAYLSDVRSSLPAGVTVRTLAVVSSSPLAVLDQAQAPLSEPRMAEIAFTASSPTVPVAADWIDNLKKLPGYAGAVPSAVSLVDGAYEITISMSINQDALWNRHLEVTEEESE